jgi:hypothetical protein
MTRRLSAQVVVNNSDKVVVDSLREQWESAGFEVGPRGISGFPLSASIAHFESFFNVKPLDPSRFVDKGLPLEGLDEGLRKGVAQILFTRVDFGSFD